MQLKNFMSCTDTTRDTIRYYIEQGLLTPDKISGNYVFQAQDIADYQEIVQLKKMGFSIAAIHDIKLQHDANCSSKAQWQHNLALIEDKITAADQEIARIKQQKNSLIQAKRQLNVLLDK